MKSYGLSFLLLLSAVYTSCTGGIKPQSAPDDLIPEKKMVELMTELSVYEAHYQQRYQHISNYHRVVIKSGDRLFKKYHVTKKQYLESFNYYAHQQAKMTNIYKKVIERLNRETKKIGAENTRNEKKMKATNIAIQPGAI